MNQFEADVVVIAAGASGLAAAVATAELGAKVIAFEKASTTGGTGNMGMGPFAVESRLQRIKQVKLSREDAFRIFMDYTHWRVDAALVSTYINKSAGTLDWLEKMGVEFVEPASYFPGANFTWHLIKPTTGLPGPRASAAMMKVLTDKARELGVKIFLQTPVKKIIKEGGQITGVMAEDKNGETVQAKAKAVIIATGGFGDNVEWIKKYTGYEFGRDLFSFRIPGLTGDGIRMAWEAGAAPTEMTMELIYGIPSAMELLTVSTVFRQPNLVVNLQGERFINEEIIGNTTFTGNAVARQKNRCAFAIFDEATKQYYYENGVDFVAGIRPTTAIDNFDVELKQALDQGSKDIFVANTLEEIASKTGINPDGLRKTVDDYNKCCETGRDEVFHKNYKYLRPVKQPKFYVGRFFPGAYGTLGGIKINHRTEVLNKDHEVIPGLYAAGTDACTIYGDSYVFVLPGNTMGFALNSGRMAGENAAAYVKAISR